MFMPSSAPRAMSQVADEILDMFNALGAPVQVTVDIESTALERLSPDQVNALRENLSTLGFSDWSIE